MKLAAQTGLSDRELNEVIDHPRVVAPSQWPESQNWITGSR